MTSKEFIKWLREYADKKVLFAPSYSQWLGILKKIQQINDTQE
jgi:hypothetical protein